MTPITKTKKKYIQKATLHVIVKSLQVFQSTYVYDIMS